MVLIFVICVHMYSCICVHVCVCMSVEVRSHCWISSSVIFHLIFLRQELLLNPELIDLDRLANSQDPSGYICSVPDLFQCSEVMCYCTLPVTWVLGIRYLLGKRLTEYLLNHSYSPITRSTYLPVLCIIDICVCQSQSGTIWGWRRSEDRRTGKSNGEYEQST